MANSANKDEVFEVRADLLPGTARSSAPNRRQEDAVESVTSMIANLPVDAQIDVIESIGISVIGSLKESSDPSKMGRMHEVLEGLLSQSAKR